MSLADVIGDFATDTYTATRTTEAGYASTGRVVAGTKSTFSIVASVQPLSGRDIAKLPEGYVGTETKKLYTLTALVATDANNRPDSVAIDGEDWGVVNVEKWEAFGVTFYRALVSRKLVTS